METTTIENAVNDIRKKIKDIAAYVKTLTDSVKKSEKRDEKQDQGEMIANLMLTYRHLEDASMRLGKVLQANDGGISVYDKATTVGA